MDRVAEELGLDPDWFSWVAAINLFAPHSFTVAQFMRIFPYGSAQVNQAHLASAVRQGYLTDDGQGEFRATELGMNLAVFRCFQAANDAIAPLRPMPADDLQRLVNLLARIVDAAFATPQPPSPFIMAHKRDSYERLGMKDSVEGFAARCLELEGYRDDCYIATWQAHRIEGHAWEVLDQFTRDGALTIDILHAKTSRREVTQQTHIEDVHDLVARGWVIEYAGMYQPTDEGRRVRAEAEALTDKYFFAPWARLNESELAELASLASQLRDGLKSSSEQ